MVTPQASTLLRTSRQAPRSIAAERLLALALIATLAVVAALAWLAPTGSAPAGEIARGKATAPSLVSTDAGTVGSALS